MSHMSSMESLTSQISQTQSRDSVTERPVPPTYPSIDSVLKASVPSSGSSADSIWALHTASVSGVGIDETPVLQSPSTESLPQERPISYLAPLPVFPMPKRYRNATSDSSPMHSEISPSPPATPSPPSPSLSNTDSASQLSTTLPPTPTDSRQWKKRPPIPERESSLEFEKRRQHEQQDRERIYLTIHPSFPAFAPAKHPHIIDRTQIASAPPQSIGFADVVVTALHNHSPATLSAFLKLRTWKFDFWFERGALRRFYIQRRKKFVTVGFEQAGRKKKLDEGFTYRIVAGPEGAWEPLCAMGKMNGAIFGLRKIDAYVRRVFVVRMMREMGWIEEGGSGSKFVEGEM